MTAEDISKERVEREAVSVAGLCACSWRVCSLKFYVILVQKLKTHHLGFPIFPKPFPWSDLRQADSSSHLQIQADTFGQGQSRKGKMQHTRSSEPK